MAMLRWDPWSEVAMLQRDVDRLLGRATGNTREGGALLPPMDVFRDGDGFTVRLELAGLRPEDVDVSANDGVLTVAGERKLDAGIAEDAWIRRERAVGRFERSLSLPEGTDPGGIRASFDNGVLELHVPHPPQRRPHRIEVNAAGAGSEQVAVDAGAGAQS